MRRNPSKICVARLGSPIIMIGDGFVLTQHDLLEDKASLSKFWLSRSALSGQVKEGGGLCTTVLTANEVV